MITTGKAWLVGIQFRPYKERFTKEEDALRYANELAKRIGGEIVEVFECVSNLAAQIPVVEVKEAE